MRQYRKEGQGHQLTVTESIMIPKGNILAGHNDLIIRLNVDKFFDTFEVAYSQAHLRIGHSIFDRDDADKHHDLAVKIGLIVTEHSLDIGNPLNDH